MKAIDYLGVKRSKQETLRAYGFWMQKHVNSPGVYKICVEILEQALITIGDVEKTKNISKAIEIGNSLGDNPSLSKLEDFSFYIKKALVEINEHIY